MNWISVNNLFILMNEKNSYMYSFIICCLLLIASYFIYAKSIEKIVGVDETRQTPVGDWKMV